MRYPAGQKLSSTERSPAARTWSRPWRWVPTQSRGTAVRLRLGRRWPGGVVRVFEILEDEIRICLGLLGVGSFAELTKAYCSRSPTRGPAPPSQRVPTPQFAEADDHPMTASATTPWSVGSNSAV